MARRRLLNDTQDQNKHIQDNLKTNPKDQEGIDKILDNTLSTFSSTVREFNQEKKKSKDLNQDPQLLDFIIWLEKTVKELADASELSFDPSLMQINRCLVRHEGTLLGLIASYEIVRRKLKEAERDYNTAFAKYYSAIRRRENPTDLSAQKYLGQKELEYLVLEEHGKDLRPLEDKVIFYDSKSSTLKRLLNAWESFRYLLSTLSSNQRAEIAAHLKHTDGSTGGNTEEDFEIPPF